MPTVSSGTSRATGKPADPGDRAGTVTRGALLQAATAVFVEQGYELARVRDIADRASANVAAINYHFGGKQALYVAVLRQHAGERIERYPLPDPTVATSGEAGLRTAIDMLLSRFLADDQRGVVPKLLMREFAVPTPALTTLIEDLIAPQFRQLSAVVAGLLGEQAPAETVTRCSFSIVSQCMFYLFARPLVQTLAPQTYADDALEQLSAHITQFSFAALQAQRQRLETPDA